MRIEIMSNKVVQTHEELKNYLSEQINFITRSCDAFDQGHEDEAKRLAVSMRILLHDTRSSKSLLGQLGKKDTRFYDTVFEEIIPSNSNSYHRLIGIHYGEKGARFFPFLDGALAFKQLEFAEWWNNPIIVDSMGRNISRKELVLTMANKDGGAHVDPEIESFYADLARNNSIGWTEFKGEMQCPVLSPEKASVRQIAHEVLKSLIPDYSKALSLPREGFVVASASIQVGENIQTFKNSSVEKKKTKIRRNDKCPCGSGLKYKKCHGKSGNENPL